jgi:hypothetical protein
MLGNYLLSIVTRIGENLKTEVLNPLSLSFALPPTPIAVQKVCLGKTKLGTHEVVTALNRYS